MSIVAVVPIFMSAGAAALPTIAAVVTSILAIVFKPRELIALCRRKPVAAGLSGAVIALCIGGAVWWMAMPKSARAGARLDSRLVARVDWAKVAMDILAQEQAGKAPTVFVAADAGLLAPIIEDNNPSRTSYAGGPSPNHLQPLWSFHPDDSLFLSAPAIAGTRIFVSACQSDLGGYTGLLACLDAQTGKPLWQINSLNDDVLKPFFSSPALTQDGKYLVIGQGLHQDKDCSLLCFDAATGKFRWGVKSSLHIESSPAIFGDVAVVGAGAIEGPDGRATGDPGHVIGVRISDGKELWRQPVIDPESSPVIDENGIAYIGSGFNGSALVALRTQPDEELKAKNLTRIVWQTPVAQPATASISLIGDVVIAAGGNSDVVHSAQNSQGFVAAIDRKTGKIRWQTLLEDAVLGGAAARDGLLICPIRTGEVAALALDTGKILWRTHISGNSPIIASCGFTGERVYAVSSDGYLAILDPKTGNILEKIYLNDQGKPGTGLSTSPPQIANGRIYVGSETGGLRCLVGTDAVGGSK